MTPDDRNVVFVSSRSGRISPWIVPIEGGEPAQITDAFAFTSSGDVSPTGQLVFSSGNEQGEPFFVVCDLPDCANRRDVRRPPNASPGIAVRWRPGGREIAYVGTEGGGTNIWSVPLDGGPPRQITHFTDESAGAITGFAWSPDGRRLAIHRTTIANDIVLLRLRP